MPRKRIDRLLDLDEGLTPSTRTYRTMPRIDAAVKVLKHMLNPAEDWSRIVGLERCPNKCEWRQLRDHATLRQGLIDLPRARHLADVVAAEDPFYPYWGSDFLMYALMRALVPDTIARAIRDAPMQASYGFTVYKLLGLGHLGDQYADALVELVARNVPAKRKSVKKWNAWGCLYHITEALDDAPELEPRLKTSAGRKLVRAVGRLANAIKVKPVEIGQAIEGRGMASNDVWMAEAARLVSPWIALDEAIDRYLAYTAASVARAGMHPRFAAYDWKLGSGSEVYIDGRGVTSCIRRTPGGFVHATSYRPKDCASADAARAEAVDDALLNCDDLRDREAIQAFETFISGGDRPRGALRRCHARATWLHQE